MRQYVYAGQETSLHSQAIDPGVADTEAGWNVGCCKEESEEEAAVVYFLFSYIPRTTPDISWPAGDTDGR